MQRSDSAQSHTSENNTTFSLILSILSAYPQTIFGLDGLGKLGNFIKRSTIGDLYEIVMKGGNFITTELYQRSLETGAGIGHIGPTWQNILPKMVAVSGTEANVRKVLTYGETRNHSDSSARKVIRDQIHHIVGDAVITKIGPEAQQERSHLKKFIGRDSSDDIFRLCEETFKDCIASWDSTSLYQDNIIYYVANIIGAQVVGLDHIPKEYIPTLRRFDKVINSGKGGAELKHCTEALLAMNEELMNPDKVSTKDTHITPFLPEGFENFSFEKKKKALQETKFGAGLIAQSNLSMAIMGVLAEVFENKSILNKLRAELASNDKWQDSWEELNKLAFLNACYYEGLRKYAPAILARSTSKPFDLTVENLDGKETTYKIPKNSFLFTPLRQICNDTRIWKDPYLFDPSRFLDEKNRNYLNKVMGDHFVPFGAGPRACPASTLFAPMLFKYFVAHLAANYDLTLNETVHPIPVESTSSTWDVSYYAELERRHDEDNSNKMKMQG